MMNFLVVVEDNRGSVHRMSLEAIVGAQKLGGNITALVLGSNAESLAQELSFFDIDNAFVPADACIEIISTPNFAT